MHGPVRFGHGQRFSNTRLLTLVVTCLVAATQASTNGAAADDEGHLRTSPVLFAGSGPAARTAAAGPLADASAAGPPGPTIGGLTLLRTWPLPPAPPSPDLAFEPLDVAIVPGVRYIADARNNGIIVQAADGTFSAFWPASAAVTAGPGRPQALVRAVTVLRPELDGVPGPLAESAIAVLWQRFIATADAPGLTAERAALEIRRLDGEPTWVGLLPATLSSARDLAFRGVNKELFVLADDVILRFGPRQLDRDLFGEFIEQGRTPLAGPEGGATRLAVLRDGFLAVVRAGGRGVDLLDWTGQVLRRLDLGGALPQDIAADAMGQLKVLVRPAAAEAGRPEEEPLVYAFDSAGAAGTEWSAATLGAPAPPNAAWPWSIAADGSELALVSADTRFAVYSGDPARSLVERAGGPQRSVPSDADALAAKPAAPERLVRLEMQADGSIATLDPASGGVYAIDGSRLGLRRPVPLDSLDFTLGPRDELYVLTSGGRVRAYGAVDDSAAVEAMPGLDAADALLWSRAVDEPQLPQLLQGGWSGIGLAGDDLLVGLPSARRIAVLSPSTGELQNTITAGELENGFPLAAWSNPIGSFSWAFWPVDLAVEHRSFGRDRAWALDAVSGLVIGFNSDGSQASVESVDSHVAGLVAPPLRVAASLPEVNRGGSSRLAVLLADGTVQIIETASGQLELAAKPLLSGGEPVAATDIAWTRDGQLLLAEVDGSQRAIHLLGLQRSAGGGHLPKPPAVAAAGDADATGRTTARPVDRASAVPRANTRPRAAHGPSSCVLEGRAEVADADLVEGDTTTAQLSLWATCPDGYGSRADILFVVDRSGSMAGASFSAVQDTVASVITLLDGSVHRVGLVGFNATAHVIVPLTYDGHDVVRGLNVLMPEGGTDLTAAIQVADLHLQHEGRPGARPVVVLLTDGGHNEGGARQRLVREAEALRERGAAILAVGLGAAVDTELLAALVDQPDHYLPAATPRGLAHLAWPLASLVGDTVPGNLLVDLSWPGAIGAGIVERSLQPRGLASSGRALWSLTAMPEDRLDLVVGVRAHTAGFALADRFARVTYTDGEGRHQVLDLPPPRLTIHSKLATNPDPRIGRVYLPSAVSAACIRAPRADIALVLDASRSMDEPFDKDGAFTKREVVWREADRFVDQLALGQQRGALVVFNAEAHALQVLTTDPGALKRALARPVATAYASRIDLGLVAAGAVLDVPRAPLWLPELDPGSTEPVGRTIVLVTDGRPIPFVPWDAFETASSLRAKGVRIVTVGLGPKPDVYVLRQLAGSTGEYLPAPTAPALVDAFRAVARALACPAR